MPRITPIQNTTVALLYLSLLLLCACKSGKKTNDKIYYGKTTFSEQLATDINTCIAYVSNLKTANSIEEQLLNIETSATIYEQISTIYDFINARFTLNFYEDEIITELHTLLIKLLNEEYISEDLIAIETDLLLEKLLEFKQIALDNPINKDDYTIIVSQVLKGLNERINYKTLLGMANSPLTITNSTKNNSRRKKDGYQRQQKIIKSIQEKKKKLIHSHLIYQKLEIYLATFKKDFQNQSIYNNWVKSITASKDYSHPNQIQDSMQLAILKKQMVTQKKLLRETLTDWNISLPKTAYANILFEDDDD